MALNLMAASHRPNICSTPSLLRKHKHLLKLHAFSSSSSSSFATSAQSESTEGGVTVEDASFSFSESLSSTRTQLDLLEQLTSTSSTVDGYETDGSLQRRTIRDQLAQLWRQR